MNGVHYITAVEQRRRAYWENLFGTDELPVKTPDPRWQHVDPGRHETLAYDLDTTALHPMQRERLAQHLAMTNGMRVEDARAMVETSTIPVKAHGCRLVERGRERNAV